jgi:glycosyltransferase
MKFSIITAVYRAEKTVSQAIESVAVQSYRNLEHIVVEGCSPDGSLAAIRKASHARMVVISEPDRGIYDALNKGIERASGDIVGCMHADDSFTHERVLERIAAAFADPAIEAVYGDLDYVSKDDTSSVIRHWQAGPFERRKLTLGWMPPHPTLYVRRHVFERYGAYDVGFRVAADYEFVLRYFSQTLCQPGYIPEVLVKMRVGGESNRNLAKVLLKMREDYRALRRYRVGGLITLAAKTATKLPQFVLRDEL